jgi:putative salt-induced outer membrane protein
MKKINLLVKFCTLFCAFVSIAAFADDIKPGFSNESGLGVVMTSGNTDTSTVSLAQKNVDIIGKNVYKFDGSYLRASNQGAEQALQWSLGLRYERELDKEFNAYVAETVMSDRYQGIDQRYSSDVGAKYFIKKSEAINWSTELGYRFTRENYPYGFKNLDFIRLYNEIERTFHKGLSMKWWVEYLPNITEWKGYQFNTEFSLLVALNETFSLKSAYQLRYYNEPPLGVAHTTDTIFTTSLVAKF